ncbi:MAG: FdtA/QdtA family cupin domain-containing protein [Muribaculaceae bacterium]|nr:FdtA/QdtA family cupin domain-containing protein [Muribaculaceae bacterium]
MKGISIVEIPKMSDHRGNLSVVENFREFPEGIKRIFWIYGVPEGEGRAAHAHKEQIQLIIPVSGHFRVVIDNTKEKETFILDRPNHGLLVYPGNWISLEDFSKDAVCMVVAPEIYDESDYMREYDEFLEWVAKQKTD